MSTLSRGDALAAAVRVWKAAEDAINTYDGQPPRKMWDALSDACKALSLAFTEYDRTAPTGESVRLEIREWENAYIGDMPGLCPYPNEPVLAYVEFTIPPRPKPPEIEGVAALDAKETQ